MKVRHELSYSGGARRMRELDDEIESHLKWRRANGWSGESRLRRRKFQRDAS